MPRKSIARFGRRGRSVRVFADLGLELIRVQWREHGGRLKTESFPASARGKAEAVAFAEGVLERLGQPVAVVRPALSLGALWGAYQLATWEALRPKTRSNYEYRWRKFCPAFLPMHTLADAVTREALDQFQRALLKGGSVANQVVETIKVVKQVYAWGVDRDLIAPTKVVNYRVKLSRDVKRVVTAEYRRADADKVLAALSPRDGHYWRAWVLTTLLTECGPRQTAARSLTWDDVDLAHGLVTWRAAYDKLARERTQPLPRAALEALWVAYGWRCSLGYGGPWVLFAGNGRHRKRSEDQPYSYSSYNASLHAAEQRAGVAPVKWRAAHGFRRGIAGDVADATGSLRDAAEWIGDASIRVLEKSYIKPRTDRMEKVARLVEERGEK